MFRSSSTRAMVCFIGWFLRGYGHGRGSDPASMVLRWHADCGALRTGGERNMADADSCSSPAGFARRRAHYLAGRPPYAAPADPARGRAGRGWRRERPRCWTWAAGRGCWRARSLRWRREVVAMDPEPEMLRVARRALRGSAATSGSCGQFLRSGAVARAVSPGGDGAVVPLDGSRGDAAPAGCADRAGRRGGAVPYAGMPRCRTMPGPSRIGRCALAMRRPTIAGARAARSRHALGPP